MNDKDKTPVASDTHCTVMRLNSVVNSIIFCAPEQTEEYINEASEIIPQLGRELGLIRYRITTGSSHVCQSGPTSVELTTCSARLQEAVINNHLQNSMFWLNLMSKLFSMRLEFKVPDSVKPKKQGDQDETISYPSHVRARLLK